MSTMPRSLNFQFLEGHDENLLEYAEVAERLVLSDPNTALLKMRQFVETLAEELLERVGVDIGHDPGLLPALRALRREQAYDRRIADLFHEIRKTGNRAAHAHADDAGESIRTLKKCRILAIWYHRTFGRQAGFKPQPFTLAPQPAPSTLSPRVEEALAEQDDWDWG
ncbi:MAG: type I restriction enzyme R subunit [Bradymonadia bacterium]|jgi:type I restriction enzyme R subunit